MNHRYAAGILLLASGSIAAPLNAQMDFYQAESFGSRFNDINDHGLAVSGGAYFDFPTLTWTDIESVATATAAINNNGDVAGAMWLDEPNSIFQPAVRLDGVWVPIGWFPASDPIESSFTTYAISPNGLWVCGQMSIGCCNYGTFKYNTQTQVLTEIFNPDYVAIAGYAIMDDGTIGGWADDEPATGTRRIPVYITPDLTIVQVSPTLPTYNTNAVSAINGSGIMVGDFNGEPFIFDREADTFTTFDIPVGYLNATFTDISDDGIAVGFAQQFGDFGELMRDALIYHPDLGAQPLFLKDILLANGVDINAPTDRMGTAIAISRNGKYIAGWDDQPPFSANGWITYLDDELFPTRVSERAAPVISALPNPVTNLLAVTADASIQTLELFDADGRMVAQQAMRSTRETLDLSALSSGVYTLRAMGLGGAHVQWVVKE